MTYSGEDQKYLIGAILNGYDKGLLRPEDFTFIEFQKIKEAIDRGCCEDEIAKHAGITISRINSLKKSCKDMSSVRSVAGQLIEENKRSYIKNLMNNIWPVKEQLSAEEMIKELQEVSKIQFTNSVQIGNAILDLKNKEKLKALPTPFQTLNKKTGGGLLQGNLITIAARPGDGKTALALQSAKHIANLGMKVLYISLEMLAHELAARLIVSESNLKQSDLMKHEISDISEFEQAENKIKDMPLFISKEGRVFEDIYRETIREQPALVVIDSVNLVKSRGESERVRILNITRNIKQMAIETNIPVLMVAQLNREAEEKALPTMADIKESGSIEEDSDVVLILSTFHEYSSIEKLADKTGKTYIERKEFDEIQKRGSKVIVGAIRKNRNGETGLMFMEFNASKFTFRELDLDGVPY